MLAKAAGFFAKDKEPGKRPVYSRLTVQNRCYGRIKSEMEKYKKYFGYSSRWVRARDTEYFELWQGEKTPDRIYDITRDSAPYGPVRRFDRWGPKEKPKEGAPQLRKTLASMVMEADAEASATFLQDIRINEYTYTFCKDEPPLGTPDAEFARPAKRGEQIDIFEIYLTQIPGSRKKEHAYCNYPLLFFLNGYPLFSTRSDDEGYARIPLPKGTQGRLGILSEAFDSGDGHLLYDEWTPVKFFTAKGGEMVYRIPPHKNITGW